MHQDQFKETFEWYKLNTRLLKELICWGCNKRISLMSTMRRPRSASRTTHGGDTGSDDNPRPKRRPLADLAGPHWAQAELEDFYAAYKKHGTHWVQVAACMENRSEEMVKALYNMTKMYLSLKEASSTGLVAVATDLYATFKESKSEGEREEEGEEGEGEEEEAKSGRGGSRPKKGEGVVAPESKLEEEEHLLPRTKRNRTVRLPRTWSNSRPSLQAGVKAESGEAVTNSGSNENGKGSDAVHGTESEDEKEERSAKKGSRSRNGGGVEACRDSGWSSLRPPCKGTPPWKGLNTELETKSSKRGRHGDPRPDDTAQGQVAASGGGVLGGVQPGDGTEEEGEEEESPGIGLLKLGAVAVIERDEEGEEAQGRGEKGKRGRTARRRQGGGEKEEEEEEMQEAFRDSDAGQPTGLDALVAVVDQLGEESAEEPRKERARNPSSTRPSPLKALRNAPQRPPEPSPVRSLSQTPSKRVRSKPTSRNATPVKKKLKLGDEEGGDGAKSGAKEAPKTRTPRSRKAAEAPGSVNSIGGHTKGDKGSTTPQKPAAESEPRKRKRKQNMDKEEVATPPPTTQPRGRRRTGTSAKKPALPPAAAGVEESGVGDGAAAAAGKAEGETETGCMTGGGSSLPAKLRSKKRAMGQIGGVAANVAHDVPGFCPHAPPGMHPSVSARARLAHCLSSPLVRRWCRAEWMYSALELPWFARNEFTDYLRHLRLHHITALTRAEWGSFRSSLGKPRRLSNNFLEEERRKLAQYREGARAEYGRVRAAGGAVRIPMELARPLTVGQRVVANHPRTGQVADGSVLTVDKGRCRVQFEKPELGVELVQDIDVMPVNPLENLPETMRNTRRFAFEARLFSGMEGRAESGGGTRVVSSASHVTRTLLHEKLDRAASLHFTLPPTGAGGMEAEGEQDKEATPVPRGGGEEVVVVEVVEEEREALVLLGLQKALDKKEALLKELRCMDVEAEAGQIRMGEDVAGGGVAIGLRGLQGPGVQEAFQRQYASLLINLKHANKHVEDALSASRNPREAEDRVKHHPLPSTALPMEALPPPPTASMRRAGKTGRGRLEGWEPEDSGYMAGSAPIGEMAAGARREARSMVASAMQVMAGTREADDPLPRLSIALEGFTSLTPNLKSRWGRLQVDGPLFPQGGEWGEGGGDGGEGGRWHGRGTGRRPAVPANPLVGIGERGRFDVGSCLPKDAVEVSELMASCVATLIMIQNCAEKRLSVADVVLTLDSALSSLRPRAPQNLKFFKEIESTIGEIKSLLVAEVPAAGAA